MALPMPEPAPVTMALPATSSFIRTNLRTDAAVCNGRLVDQHVATRKELERRALDAPLPLLGIDHRVRAVRVAPQR